MPRSFQRFPEGLPVNIWLNMIELAYSYISLVYLFRSIWVDNVQVDHFKHLGSVLTRHTRGINMRIAMAKETFNRKISLLTSKLNIELRKKLVRCYVWSVALCGSETWTRRKLEPSIWKAFKCGAGGERKRQNDLRKKLTNTKKNQLNCSYCEKKLPSSRCHWRADDGIEEVGRRRIQIWETEEYIGS